ncbi:MAG: hypothetical protein ACW96X_04170 [Promethearchaeota archaeon]|jgi:hypothetical protein
MKPFISLFIIFLMEAGNDDQMVDITLQNDVSIVKSTAFRVWIALLIFTVIEIILIFSLEPFLRLNFPALNPDTGPEDYYWKLNVRDTLTMIITWTFYAAHQISVWIVIYWAHKNYREKNLNRKKILKYIMVMSAILIGFTVLHLLQTQIWYDGLAQDVAIITSQGSVIVMLSILLVMQNSRRGLFFGRKENRLMRPEVTKTFMTSHQIIFSWALVYTFWFHPMDSSPALLSGFFFMGLLFIQMTLAYTRIHLNKWWVLAVESYVVIHATIVAIAQWIDFDADPPMWPMFLLGFLAMLVFTYIHGLGLKNWLRWSIVAAYFVLLIFMYIPQPFGFGREITYFVRFEFLWIPIILFLIAFIAAALAHTYLILKKRRAINN